MDRKVIFVMGPGHCGSTLFDLIMGSHSDVFSLGEFHRIHGAIDDFQEGYPKICGVCTGRCEFWNQRASLPILKMYFSCIWVVLKLVCLIAFSLAVKTSHTIVRSYTL